MSIFRLVWVTLLLLLWSAVSAAAVVHLDNFIPNALRTNFNGFEGVTSDIYSGGEYTEDGITVANVGGGSFNTGIFTTCSGAGSGCFNPSHEGARSWYPNGGDNGYTRITRSGAGNFLNVGFLLGSGFGTDIVDVGYELVKNAIVVKSDILAGFSSTPAYLGFGGGGFDEIRVRNGRSPFTFHDGSVNALAIDSIELADSVAEPSNWLLLLVGLGALIIVGLLRRH